MVTLTEIMWQKDDRSFAELLNRLCTKQKNEPLSVDDKAPLEQCVVDAQHCPVDALHIFATNKEVDAHDATTVAALGLTVVNIPAEDYRKRIPWGFKGNRRDLPDNIKVGARVMVTRNVDIEDGLVSGAFGTITCACMWTYPKL